MLIINSMLFNNKYIIVDNLVFINTTINTRLKDSEGYVDTTPTTVIRILNKTSSRDDRPPTSGPFIDKATHPSSDREVFTPTPGLRDGGRGCYYNPPSESPVIPCHITSTQTVMTG